MKPISLNKILGITKEEMKEKTLKKQKRPRKNWNSLKELKDILLRAFIHKIIGENLDNPNFDIMNIFKENADLRKLYNTSNKQDLHKFAKKIFNKD